VYEFQQDLWQLGFQHDFGRANVSVVGGYQEWVWHHAFGDGSVGPMLNPTPEQPDGLFPISAVPDGIGGLVGQECNIEDGQAGLQGGCAFDQSLDRFFGYQDTDEKRQHWTVEAKLRTDLDGRANLLFGVNYQSSNAKTLQTNFNNLLDNTGPVAGFYPTFITREDKSEFESYSAFGEIYFDVSDQLKLTAGVRFNRDEKDIEDRYMLLSSVDVNLLFGGAFGEPIQVRLFPWQLTIPAFFDGAPIPERERGLLELYGALDEAETAIAAGQGGPPRPFGFFTPAYASLLEAVQRFPWFPNSMRSDYSTEHPPSKAGKPGADAWRSTGKSVTARWSMDLILVDINRVASTPVRACLWAPPESPY
jgi:hypothetical protein